MRRAVQGVRSAMARELGQYHSVLPVPAADQESDLHDECDRVVEHGDEEADAESENLSERRLGAEVAVPVHPGSVEELEGDPSLKACAAELPDDIRSGARAIDSTMKISDTQSV
jgi:hypothetical protein